VKSPIPKSWRRIIAVFILLTTAFVTVSYFANSPPASEQNFQFYVLGANRLTEAYFPRNNPNVKIGSSVSWYLGVTNLMGDVQLVEIVTKFSNLTGTSPSDAGAVSSSTLTIDFSQVLLNNETWEFPFDWRIINATVTGTSAYILTIRINNSTYQVSDWSSTGGYNFRFIFELWTWQAGSNGYEFGWTSGGQHQTAWLQMWFNLTNPKLPQS
jgi:uncharacterized membrane protein